MGIQQQYEYDEAFAAESRQFYESLDTTLVFQWHLVIRSSNMYMKWWDLLDMRISSLEVTALADYDAAHPAGLSLDDILNISYWYKRSRITTPVEVRIADAFGRDFTARNE